ncbi:MAG: hypothetical protein JWN28_754 [Candidatus Saccharibacteria bacterium]|nr:hypothetical protein [Candidatus Saccharibacteria bacterium]
MGNKLERVLLIDDVVEAIKAFIPRTPNTVHFYLRRQKTVTVSSLILGRPKKKVVYVHEHIEASEVGCTHDDYHLHITVYIDKRPNKENRCFILLVVPYRQSKVIELNRESLIKMNAKQLKAIRNLLAGKPTASTSEAEVATVAA